MKKLTNITKPQIAEKGVQSLADRPNVSSQYGTGGLSPGELKLRFDSLATLLAEKINELINTISSEEAASYVRVVLDEYGVDNLGSLVQSMTSGAFAASILKVLPSVSATQKISLQQFINTAAKNISTNADDIDELKKNKLDEETFDEYKEQTDESIKKLQDEKLNVDSTASQYRRVYIIDTDGKQKVAYISDAPLEGALPAYSAGGQLEVGTPTEDKYAANRGYVENAIDEALGDIHNVRHLPLSKSDGDYSIAQEIDVDTSRGLGKGSIGLGIGCVAGSKAFTIISLNAADKTYTLNSVEGLEIGDVYSVHILKDDGTSEQQENRGAITAIDTSTNTVTVDTFFSGTFNFAVKLTYIEDGIDNEENTFRIIAKPNVGTRRIGDVSAALGLGCSTLSKGGLSLGKDCLTYGSWGFSGGRGSRSAYCGISYGGNCHAEGKWSVALNRNTRAQGESSMAIGGSTFAQNGYSFAGGYNCHSLSACAFAFGDGTRATHWCSVAFGRGTRTGTVVGGTALGKFNAPNSNTLFSIGNGSSDTERSNAFEVTLDGTVKAKSFEGELPALTSNGDVDCPVWFSAIKTDGSLSNRRGYKADFKYNPTQSLLKVGNKIVKTEKDILNFLIFEGTLYPDTPIPFANSIAYETFHLLLVNIYCGAYSKKLVFSPVKSKYTGSTIYTSELVFAYGDVFLLVVILFDFDFKNFGMKFELKTVEILGADGEIEDGFIEDLKSYLFVDRVECIRIK